MRRENKVREFREKLGLSRLALAGHSGVCYRVLTTIELYDHFPSEAVRAKLVRVLKTPEHILWPWGQAANNNQIKED